MICTDTYKIEILSILSSTGCKILLMAWQTVKKEIKQSICMSYNLTIINLKNGRRLSLKLMTNWSLTCNPSNACLYTDYQGHK